MFTDIVLFISLLLFAQSLFSVYLMLYSWQHTDALDASRGPEKLFSPEISFTVLLPARNEEAVIYETIKKVCQTNYPSDLLEVVVICHQEDKGTIAEAQRAINEINSWRVRIATFSDTPINKPHGLNVGLRGTFNEVVTVFDAEDDIHADIFHIINTVMLQEGVHIVQSGVQLMNFRDHWFSAHNCMEYFFWFKSRLHFHAHVGMIPLGGNTVFIHRTLLEKAGGWDEHCLTEDAEIGLRLSILGEPIRVIYDRRYVTREETPPTLFSFVRQRTRWQQGFLQVLWKGDWLALPRVSQRLLAFYTFTYPFLQALLTLLWLPTAFTVFWLKLSVITSLISFLPLYSLFFQLVVTLVGAYLFTREYGLKFPFFLPLTMTITFLPFQWLQGLSSLRVVYRVLFRQQNWEKTLHLGAHRHSQLLPELLSSPIEEQDIVVLPMPRITIPLPIVTPSGSLSQLDIEHLPTDDLPQEDIIHLQTNILPHLDTARTPTGTLIQTRPALSRLAEANPFQLEESELSSSTLEIFDDDEATVPRPALRVVSAFLISEDDEATVPHPALRRGSGPLRSSDYRYSSELDDQNRAN